MKDQFHRNVNYGELKWNHYLEKIILEIFISKSSINPTANDYERITSFIRCFLKMAYERDRKLTRESISNCVQKI